MSNIKEEKESLSKIFYLCFLAICCPKRFVEHPIVKKENTGDRIYIVTKAFWKSLFLVIFPGVLGGLAGLLFSV